VGRWGSAFKSRGQHLGMAVLLLYGRAMSLKCLSIFGRPEGPRRDPGGGGSDLGGLTRCARDAWGSGGSLASETRPYPQEAEAKDPQDPTTACPRRQPEEQKREEQNATSIMGTLEGHRSTVQERRLRMRLRASHQKVTWRAQAERAVGKGEY